MSNIEIDLTGPPCDEPWTGWSVPSTGAVNLFGDPQFDLIDDGTSSAITESIRSVNPDHTAMFTDNMCGGDLTIISVTGLNAAMAALRAASDQEFADPGISSISYAHSSTITANVANNIGIIVNLDARYDFDGLTWTAGESAGVQILYNGFTVESVVLQNDSALGTVSVVDPGLVWRIRPQVGPTTYSHPPDASGGTYPGFGSAYSFHAPGTHAVASVGPGTDYPLTTSQFFATAGQFEGDWTVAEALALL